MAKTKELHFSMQRTYNLGNYESTKIEMGLVVSIDETDSVEEVKDKSISWLNQSIGKKFKELYKNE